MPNAIEVLLKTLIEHETQWTESDRTYIVCAQTLTTLLPTKPGAKDGALELQTLGCSLNFISATFELALVLQTFNKFDSVVDGNVVFDTAGAVKDASAVDNLLAKIVRAKDACRTEKQVVKPEVQRVVAIIKVLLDKANKISERIARSKMEALFDANQNDYSFLDSRRSKNVDGLKWMDGAPGTHRKEIKKALATAKKNLFCDASGLDVKVRADRLVQACPTRRLQHVRYACARVCYMFAARTCVIHVRL